MRAPPATGTPRTDARSARVSPMVVGSPKVIDGQGWLEKMRRVEFDGL
jgi:hypothetical protein